MEKLCVIFGGASCEHDISIITAMQLCKNLEKKYKIEKIYLGLDNSLYLATQVTDISYFEDKKKIKLKPIMISGRKIYVKNVFWKKYCEIACLINCCHGGVGENGDLAGFCNVNDIPYTSTDCLPSHIAMDKSLAKKLLDGIVPTVSGVQVDEENFEEKVKYIRENLNDDLIVKPNSLGSSIGVKACNKMNFTEQIEAIFLLNDSALVENRIEDMEEYNQACFMSNDEIKLSAIENPISKSKFLSFDEKYLSGKTKGTDRILPAKISSNLEKRINDYTVLIYKTLKLNGLVRIDYIYDKLNDILYFNEVNTIPGSMAFYLYEPLGIDYISLIESLIENVKDNKKYSYFDTAVLRKKLL